MHSDQSYENFIMEPMSQFDFPSIISSEYSNIPSVETTPNISQDPPPPTILIRPTYPPQITVDELVTSKPNGGKPSKSSNAFIIYRKAYVKELHSRGISLQMTQISPVISESWKQEPENVKAEYKRLAEAAKKKYKEMWPPKPRRRHQKKQQPPIPQTLLLQTLQTNPSTQFFDSYFTTQTTQTTQTQTIQNNPELFDPSLIDPFYIELDTLLNSFNNQNDNIIFSSSPSNNNPLYINEINNNRPTISLTEGNDNNSVLTYLKNLRSTMSQRRSMPESTNRKGPLLAYHQLMSSWHKELKRPESAPYRTFNDAKEVPFFTLHLV
ncbi:3718_t:CDS:2 [Diversispora eburnea]|uniref:3718_t:CDS:1 n=1 Tax=Diversispora eburnea TaxID=1213867 RepID=A0A9N8ZE13_9GLOM|nr:3718_t:CDS:2 [Diversispora eburnea]